MAILTTSAAESGAARVRTGSHSDTQAPDALIERIISGGHKLDPCAVSHLSRVIAAELSPETLATMRALVEHLA